jgi:hypothetical protein
MKPLFWDSIDPDTGLPYTYDSPNLTWDGILEPGDENYVPPPPKAHPKPRKKNMKHNSYYPTSGPEQIIWLTNFFNKLLGYAVTLGLTPTQLAAIVADARWLIYVLSAWQPAQKAWSKAATDGVREAQTGTSGAAVVIPVFTSPAPPAADPAPGGLPAVVPTPAGALTRIFKAVQDLLENDKAIDSIRTDLRIVGTEQATPNLETVQPIFTVRIVSGQVFIDWNWGGLSDFLDMLQLQVNRGAGWVDLAYDTTPGYTDTTPFPTPPAVWKYRGQYRVGDDPVGVWSNEVSITVG